MPAQNLRGSQGRRQKIFQGGNKNRAGAPRAERGPGASSNMTDFRFCDLQNRRRKCRSFVRIMMLSPKKTKKSSSPKF